MADERIILEIQAIDAASKEIDKVINRLRLLNDEALKPYKQFWEKGIKTGIAPETLAKMFPKRERLRILASLQAKYNEELSDTLAKMADLREGTRRYQKLADKAKELARAQKSVERAIRYTSRETGISSRRFGGLSERLGNLNRRMNNFALQFVWGALSILGVTWSMQMVLKGTLGVLDKYVGFLDKWSNAAYQVALWMALAKRQGIDVTKITGESPKKSIDELVKAGLLLKSTLGSVREAFALFFADVLMKSPKLQKELKTAAKEIVNLFSNKEVRRGFKEFLSGLLKGITWGIRELPHLIKLFDRLGNVLAMISSPIISFLGLFLPGFKELNKKLKHAHSGLEKLGILIGGLGALAPLLVPLLAIFQFLLSIIQAIIFFMSKLIGAFKWIIDHAEAIKDALEGIAERIKGGLGGLGGMLGQYLVPISPMVGAYRILTGHWPNEVHVNQYINIGTVNKTADVKDVAKELYNPYSYGGVY